MDEAAGQPAVLVRRRALIPFFAAALSVAGVFALTARRRDPVATETNLSSLYHCKNGDPGVATRYENGEWGTVTGDWYILAQTTDAGTYDCGRMIFGLRGSDDLILRQEMLYVGTSDDDDHDFFTSGTDYWFNVTEKQVKRKVPGKWERTADDNDGWSSVPLVGTYKGSKWFAWYTCGPDAASMKRGYAYVLKDSKDADDAFYREVKKKLKKLGLFDYSSGFTKYPQSDDCDYTWPTAGLR